MTSRKNRAAVEEAPLGLDEEPSQEDMARATKAKGRINMVWLTWFAAFIYMPFVSGLWLVLDWRISVGALILSALAASGIAAWIARKEIIYE